VASLADERAAGRAAGSSGDAKRRHPEGGGSKGGGDADADAGGETAGGDAPGSVVSGSDAPGSDAAAVADPAAERR
jgi:hypothetical protein